MSVSKYGGMNVQAEEDISEEITRSGQFYIFSFSLYPNGRPIYKTGKTPTKNIGLYYISPQFRLFLIYSLSFHIFIIERYISQLVYIVKNKLVLPQSDSD